MRLMHMDPPIHMNVKKIRRLMKKYGLFCPIRKANPYRRMAKAMATNNIAPNLVNREFEKHGPRKILLTDITYIINGKAPRVYMSTIIDAYTKEILSWVLSDFLWVNPKFCVNAELWCKIEQKYFKAGAAQAAAAFSTKITALRGDVKGGGVSLRPSRPLTCLHAAGQSGMRSAKNTANCAWIMLQSCRQPVHFFVISIMAKYSIFSRLSSVGNTDFDLVTFRSCRLKPSIALVV